ncbi:hypothetical protein SLEP1_g33217 [Rubroshorea leprosula]|uniref:BHLH domain-containing protein n=1 Tax=Rubroshorea leprosula TaxID=152421 RepID=A0AAV5KG45_9ROSI|nr:hypothetical protein SLEP1_g33217 [Rubroshorea leprosula]
MRNHPGLMPTNAILYTTLINERILGAEAKLAYAQKHSLAERDLRMRINKQFDNVRSVLPNLIKKDKASVLTEIVRQVRDLKRKVDELKAYSHGRILERMLPGEAND